MDHIIVTGGAGFIGSCFVRKAIAKGYRVTVIDKLTYSANMDNFSEILANKNFSFVKADICDPKAIKKILKDTMPSAVINFAAETHVDNSISSPKEFIDSNIYGTYNLLNCSLAYFKSLGEETKFRFIQISTDEVFGSLTKEEQAFSHKTPYSPNSPYSASKAAADHLARAWHETYGLPVIITNCSNNYGPYQHEEKLIPKTITNAILGQDIPIYGKGENIRDWIYVEDHVQGVFLALENGQIGRSYLFGGDCEMKNIDLVRKICSILEEKTGKNYSKQIKFVTDRAGHDFRYAIDSSYAKKELGFTHQYNFDSAIRNTIDWYINKVQTT